MRKVLWCMLLVTVLVACNQEDVEETRENTIRNAQMDAREENLLRAAAGETLFIYDVSVDERGGELEVWLEKYEYGQLSDEKIGGMRTGIFDAGQILFTVREILDTPNALVRMVIVSESGSDSTESLIELPTISRYGKSSLLEDVTPLTDNMAIGQIIYSEEESLIIKSSWGEIGNDPTAIATELKDKPVVYLVRCSFKEGSAKVE
ncbi:hypothetical protein ACIQ2D_01960 [Lysinibacillus sp. NPDC097287]|uniref:hypothetical protein n=1 Tax=Lysinibacillus sp. NPDC097287 TaxID=3364144 RepID=UPI00381816F9